MDCLDTGEHLYETYKDERLNKKSTGIFETIKRSKIVSGSESTADCIPKIKERVRISSALHR